VFIFDPKPTSQAVGRKAAAASLAIINKNDKKYRWFALIKSS